MRASIVFLFLVVGLAAAGAWAGEPAPGGGAGPDPARLRADDLAGLMEIHAEAGRFPEAAAKGREAARLFFGLGDRLAAARTLARVGSFCLRGGMPAEAGRDLREALALQEELGDPVGACSTLNLLARVALSGPKPEEAAWALDKGWRLALDRRLRSPLFVLAETSAKVRERLCSRSPADPAYFGLVDSEIRFQDEAGWPFHARRLAYERIAVLCRDGRLGEAEASCRDLAAAALQKGDRHAAAAAWHNLGLVSAGDRSLKEDAFRQADAAYLDAERLRRAIGDWPNLAWTLNNRGFLRLDRKLFDEALPLLQEAADLAREWFAVDAEATARTNLARLGREAGREDVRAAAEARARELKGARPPDPAVVEFSPPDARAGLAYYLFLREDDRAPVVRVRGEKTRLVFTAAYTGDEFEVPVEPRPKDVRIRFKALVSFHLDRDPGMAACAFRVEGGRTVVYGGVSLFLGEGDSAVADRESNLRPGSGEPAAPSPAGFDLAGESYPSQENPVLALRTWVESFNRGEWKTFERATTAFAMGEIDRASFDRTVEKHRELPLKIVVREAGLRNPVWAEIRYSYEPQYGGDEAARKKQEETFRKEYGNGRRRAFLVREGAGWKFDFLTADGE